MVQTSYPMHSHSAMGVTTNPQATPTGNDWGDALKGGKPLYATAGTNNVKTAVGAIGNSPGSNPPHNNNCPCLTLNFRIALQGIFPTRGQSVFLTAFPLRQVGLLR
jgi:microcystin-dependent protein